MCHTLHVHLLALLWRTADTSGLLTMPQFQFANVHAVLFRQEVAGNHGVAMWGRSEMGFATDPIMVEHNLIFVVTRMQIRMDAYPQWCVISCRLCFWMQMPCERWRWRTAGQ